jgi:hypothetical protein
LNQLPTILLINILQEIGIKDNLNFGLTCKRNFQISQNFNLWKLYIEKDYPGEIARYKRALTVEKIRTGNAEQIDLIEISPIEFYKMVYDDIKKIKADAIIVRWIDDSTCMLLINPQLIIDISKPPRYRVVGVMIDGKRKELDYEEIRFARRYEFVVD